MFFYLYIIILKRNKKDKFVLIVTLSAICSMFIEAGYFIMIGDKEIDYGDFGLIVSFVWALYILSSTRIKKKDISLISLDCLFALMGMVGLIIWPYGEKIVTGDSVSYDRVAFGMTSLNYATLNIGNIIKLIFLLMYYVICLALYEVISNEQKKRIMYILYSAIKIFLVFGIFEWFFAYVFHNEVFRNAVNLILGNGSQFLGLISRNDSYMLQ